MPTKHWQPSALLRRRNGRFCRRARVYERKSDKVRRQLLAAKNRTTPSSAGWRPTPDRPSRRLDAGGGGKTSCAIHRNVHVPAGRPRNSTSVKATIFYLFTFFFRAAIRRATFFRCPSELLSRAKSNRFPRKKTVSTGVFQHTRWKRIPKFTKTSKFYSGIFIVPLYFLRQTCFVHQKENDRSTTFSSDFFSRKTCLS